MDNYAQYANWAKDNAIQEGIYQIVLFYATGEIGGVLLKAAWNLGRSWYYGQAAAKTGVELTAHGAERIAGAAATRGGVLSMEGVNATKSLGRKFIQSDGANVFLHEVTPGRFNAVIQN